MYIFNDFNLNLNLQNDFVNGYYELLTNYDLNICKGSLPTSVTDTSATVIDHVITKESPDKFKISLIISDISDHRMMILEQTGSTAHREIIEPKLVVNKVIDYSALPLIRHKREKRLSD